MAGGAIAALWTLYRARPFMCSSSYRDESFTGYKKQSTIKFPFNGPSTIFPQQRCAIYHIYSITIRGLYISRKALFAAGIIGNLLNTTAGSIGGAGSNRMRIVLE